MSDLVKRAKKVQSPVLGHYTELEVVRGDGAYLYDKEDKAYLDFACGIAVTNLGHCHPAVVRAAKNQVETLIHNCAGVTYNETNIKFCEDLLEVAPKDLDQVFLCQSGSEAVEGCLKLARYVTKKAGIIAFQGGFHGRTLGATSITSSKEKYYKPYEPLLPEVKILPRDLAEVEKIDFSEIGAVITELVTGEGGYFVQDKVFIQGLRKLCDERGALLIFDEVQTGFGRTGKMFACEHFEVVPDVMALAKGIASGFPLGAFLMKKKFSEQWSTGTHGGTYTGNLVACAAGSANIREIKKLLPILPDLAGKIKKDLENLAKKYSYHIKEIRGLGLMLAIDMGEAEKVKKMRMKALEKGLLLISCGPRDDAIRIIPPFIVTKNEIDKAIKILDEVLTSL
ncbi:MAG: aminotransferase class III-fold pyridoxal phosphate-dependent enzyme [Candidatus Margulisbacteria bacterium]|nr:aminotransferase class III-fold pyridoxal phosphate-dependent enzyme [Candidatus Margulisiibacteriota bacterium]